jgi:hypothetical protein
MTNPEFTQELLEKVKPGVKASDLKKLKRSKSDSDITPLPLPEPFELEQLKKQTNLNTLLQEQLKEKQKQIEELRKKLEAKTPPTKPSAELDHSLLARHQNLKD